MYADTRCVPRGATSEAVLACAYVIVLLLSISLTTYFNFFDQSHISEQATTNIKNFATSRPNNLLYDMERALIRLRNEPRNTVLVFPIFVGSNPTVYLVFCFYFLCIPN